MAGRVSKRWADCGTAQARAPPPPPLVDSSTQPRSPWPGRLTGASLALRPAPSARRSRSLCQASALAEEHVGKRPQSAPLGRERSRSDELCDNVLQGHPERSGGGWPACAAPAHESSQLPCFTARPAVVCIAYLLAPIHTYPDSAEPCRAESTLHFACPPVCGERHGPTAAAPTPGRFAECGSCAGRRLRLSGSAATAAAAFLPPSGAAPGPLRCSRPSAWH